MIQVWRKEGFLCSSEMIDLDKFPEAFERFESDVDVDRLRTYSELLYSFQWWAGEKWKGTARQWAAFNAEAERLGFTVPHFIREEIRGSRASGSYAYQVPTYRHEVVIVKGVSQDRYRDLKTGRFIKKP
jgi:hypothetical protein